MAKEGHPGVLIKAYRQEKSLTIKELSEISGVSVGMISQIERGLANPSLRILEHIRVALNISLSDMIESSGDINNENNGNIIRRYDERIELKVNKQGLVKQILSPHGDHDIQFMLITLPHGVRSSEVLIGPGEKAGLVIEGVVTLGVGSRVYELNAGDSFQFSSLDMHYIENQNEEDAVVLWIMNTKLQVSTI